MVRRAILIAVVILLLVGVLIYSQFQPQPNRVSGIIEADEIRVGSRVGGRVSSVEVEEGQPVSQGQKLVMLEPYDLLEREQEAREHLAASDANYRRLVAGLRSEEIAQAEARYRQREAELDLLVAGPRPEEIEAARGRLRAAGAILTLARQNYDRNQRLFEADAIQREEFDQASQKLEESLGIMNVREEELKLLEAGSREEEIRKAQALLEEAEQAWKLAQKGFREEEIAQAKATRDAAQATLNAIQEQKKELVITSPVSGAIEALDLLKGDLVPAGAPVLSVIDDKHLWVRAYVPQNRVGLKVGQQLLVTADSLNDQQFRGEIVFIARQAEFTPSNVQTLQERSKQVFRIKVALHADPEQLRPGMTVDVWLDPLGDER